MTTSSSDAAPSGHPLTETEQHQASRLRIILVITALFTGLELAGAVAARSQALLADGVHLLLDVVAMGLSVVAMRVAVARPTDRFTFGLRRVEPLAAVANALLVLLAAAALVDEASSDLKSPVTVRPTLMLIVAVLAVFVHGLCAWLLHDALHRKGHDTHDHHDHHHAHEGRAQEKGHGHALNLRGVWLHLAGDTLGALAAVAAALVIRAGGPEVVDPIGGIVVALVLVVGAFRLLRDATLVLLEAAPPHLPTGIVRDVVQADSDVAEVLELRVWTLGAGHDAVIVQVRARNKGEALSSRIGHRLRHDLGIEHVTVEIVT